MAGNHGGSSCCVHAGCCCSWWFWGSCRCQSWGSLQYSLVHEQRAINVVGSHTNCIFGKRLLGCWVGIFCGKSNAAARIGFQSIRQLFNQSGNCYMILATEYLNEQAGIADLGFGGKRRRRIQIRLSFCFCRTTVDLLVGYNRNPCDTCLTQWQRYRTYVCTPTYRYSLHMNNT